MCNALNALSLIWVAWCRGTAPGPVSLWAPPSGRNRSGLGDEAAADQLPVDLVGAFPDLGDLGVARDAERVRRDARARLVQGGEEQSEAHARLAEQIAARHPAIIERERRGRGGAVPHLVLGAQYGEARGAFLEIERRDRVSAIAKLAPFAENEIKVRDVAVADKGLAARDDDLVAVGGETGRHMRRVGAGGRLGAA